VRDDRMNGTVKRQKLSPVALSYELVGCTIVSVHELCLSELAAGEHSRFYKRKRPFISLSSLCKAVTTENI
jgi:hypothetical protein